MGAPGPGKGSSIWPSVGPQADVADARTAISLFPKVRDGQAWADYIEDVKRYETLGVGNSKNTVTYLILYGFRDLDFDRQSNKKLKAVYERVRDTDANEGPFQSITHFLQKYGARQKSVAEQVWTRLSFLAVLEQNKEMLRRPSEEAEEYLRRIKKIWTEIEDPWRPDVQDCIFVVIAGMGLSANMVASN